MLKRHDVHVVRCDQCQYGAVNEVGQEWADSKGRAAPRLKPTRFMSNSVPMPKQLSKICKGDHDHQPLLGGRAASAAFYPLPLIRAILQGINDTTQADNIPEQMAEAEYDVSLLMSLSRPEAEDS